MTTIRSASSRRTAVAGLFYPGDARVLQQTVDALLAAAAPAPAGPLPKAIIAPHAGYVYSGPVAASIYARLWPLRGRVTRVVLLGPTHRVAVRGLAHPGCHWFETPLGKVEIDQDALDVLRTLPQVTGNPAAHAQEHSLEVHVPFLQAVLGTFKLVPLAVGHASPAEVAAVLDALWGGAETLIVVSSDLSHYLPYREAQQMDRGTADAIVHLRTDIDHESACGATPVSGLAYAARRRGLSAELVDLRNSGDTAGDKSRVVGYGAFALYEKVTDAS
jgi:MEMO1 family protein